MDQRVVSDEISERFSSAVEVRAFVEAQLSKEPITHAEVTNTHTAAIGR